MKKTFRGIAESTVGTMWLHLCFCIFVGSIVAEGVPRSRLTWVNGIGHNLQHMGEGVVDISSLFGGKKVEFCHNPTAMTSDDDYVGYIGDLTQAGIHKWGRITGEVDALVMCVIFHIVICSFYFLILFCSIQFHVFKASTYSASNTLLKLFVP
jgi:hypothetical protein|mmetsp:Transcript_6722/g.12094  ORF Transcript_6722/g.12094 Transcript_6722/m.12094 type:complete len:153 (-) Transcript_6722:764-1222(-)